MIRIAVGDDGKTASKDTERILCEVLREIPVEAEVVSFSSGEELIGALDKIDFVFWDVDYKEDLDVLRSVHEHDMTIPVVIITENENLWTEAFNIHAFDFIKRPAGHERLKAILEDSLLFLDLNEKKRGSIDLPVDKGVIVQNTDDIYYFLVDSKKKILARTAGNSFFVKENLIDIYKKLNKKQFYMSHRSCILNLKYVRTLQNSYDIIMTNGEFLPLAQKRKKDFIKKLHDYLNDK